MHRQRLLILGAWIDFSLLFKAFPDHPRLRWKSTLPSLKSYKLACDSPVLEYTHMCVTYSSEEPRNWYWVILELKQFCNKPVNRRQTESPSSLFGQQFFFFFLNQASTTFQQTQSKMLENLNNLHKWRWIVSFLLQSISTIKVLLSDLIHVLVSENNLQSQSVRFMMQFIIHTTGNHSCRKNEKNLFK